MNAMKVKNGQKIEKQALVKKIAPVISFIVPFIILYYFHPDTFELTWKGRTYYLFFLWLMSLETIIVWEELKVEKMKSKLRIILFAIACALPTLYVIISQCWLDSAIIELSFKSNIGLNTFDKSFFVNLMPLSIEYLVFTILFALIVMLEYETKYLQEYSISIFFLGIIGMIYIIDNLYPYGRFTIFQFLVPTTANLAALFLGWMGYNANVSMVNHPVCGYVPLLEVSASEGFPFRAIVDWPCSGIDSLIVYTVVILIFLKKTDIPLSHKIVYFVIGAIITYVLNILRIITLSIIGLSVGGNSVQFRRFHDYYGPLYSLSWIVAYPLIISMSRMLWNKLKSRNFRLF
jgi:thaumarchaeosortase